MQCNKCLFQVPPNLRFAIMKNICPQCGNNLLSDKDVHHIEMIQSRVYNQPFSSELEESALYDVSLFIYHEIKNGYGRIVLDEIMQETKTSEPYNAEDTFSEEEKIAMRRQIEQESGIAEENEEQSGDIDDRVNRLKEIHKKRPKMKASSAIRRVGE